MTTTFAIVLGVLILTAVALVIIGIRHPNSNTDQQLFDRLEDFTIQGSQINLEKLEMTLPFTERVIYPIARKLGEFTMRFTPQNWLSSTTRKLELSGRNAKMDATLFITIEFIIAGVTGVVSFLVMRFLVKSLPLGQVFLLTVVFTVLGFFLPQYQLSRAITKRQKEVRKGMPDSLDLLTICVEAGLSFDGAMAKVAEKWDNEISKSFARVIQEIQLGKLRREALRDMEENIGISEMTSFVAALIQSEQLGVSMAKVLRVQADQMRVRRRQLAEEEAHKAPIKMLVPMAFIMFPSILIILLAPAALQIMQAGVFGG